MGNFKFCTNKEEEAQLHTKTGSPRQGKDMVISPQQRNKGDNWSLFRIEPVPLKLFMTKSAVGIRK